jgi:hypothetical protein
MNILIFIVIMSFLVVLGLNFSVKDKDAIANSVNEKAKEEPQSQYKSNLDPYIAEVKPKRKYKPRNNSKTRAKEAKE